jgi:hypothetical protein
MSVVRADGGEAAIAVKRDFVGVRLVEVVMLDSNFLRFRRVFS